MGIMDKLQKNSRIKETDILAQSKIFSNQEMVPTKVPMINVALSGDPDGGLTAGLTVLAGPSKNFKTSFGLLMAAAYLEKYKDSDADSIKGLIISGSFQTVNDEFYIEYEAYDIHDWRQLTNRQLSCSIHDIICVHDNFLISVERNISPFLHDELDLEATINSLKQRKRKNIPTRARSLDNDTWFEKDTTNDNMREFDLQVEELQDEQGQYGDRHFREFDIKKLLPQQSSMNIFY